jgi:hypothetical protein
LISKPHPVPDLDDEMFLDAYDACCLALAEVGKTLSPHGPGGIRHEELVSLANESPGWAQCYAMWVMSRVRPKPMPTAAHFFPSVPRKRQKPKSGDFVGDLQKV